MEGIEAIVDCSRMASGIVADASLYVSLALVSLPVAYFVVRRFHNGFVNFLEWGEEVCSGQNNYLRESGNCLENKK